MVKQEGSIIQAGYSLGSLLRVEQVLECSRILARYRPDSVWIPETWGMENFAMLAAVSRVLPGPQIGSSIINIYSRSPSLVAMGAATVDVISGGRLILGLGTSSPPIVSDLHGAAFELPLERMREYIDVIRMATSGQKIDHNGRLFRLKGFRLLVPPHRERIPIYVAAVNRGMVDLAWEKADGTILYLRPIDEMRRTIPKMQSRRRIRVCCQLITAVSLDPEKARSRARTTLAFYVAVGSIYRRFLAANGFQEETESILEEHRRSGLGRIASLVTDRMLDSLTVCGTPDECTKKMQAFADAGVDLPIAQFNPVGDVPESMELAARTFLGEPR